MPTTSPFVPASLLAILLAGSAAAADAPQVTADRAWSRATTPGVDTAGVYLTLTSPAGDRLLAVSSPAAASAELHSMSNDGGIMRMRPIEGGLDLPAGQPVTLGPAGNHIMLTGLHVPLQRGQTVRLHLTFAHSAPVDVTAPIAAPGAPAPPGTGEHDGMAGMKMP